MAKRQLGSLLPIDIGFGKLAFYAMEGLSEEGQKKEMSAFINRDPSKRVVLDGVTDTPLELLKMIRHNTADNKRIPSVYQDMVPDDNTGADDLVNKVDLPLVYIHRLPSFNTVDIENHETQNISGTNDAGDKCVLASYARIILEYKIVFVATTREAVDMMLLTWYYYISNKQESNHKYTVNYNINGELNPFECIVKSTQELLSSDVSHTYDDGRIYAAELTYEVEAPSLFAEKIEDPFPAESLRIHFGIKHKAGCSCNECK